MDDEVLNQIINNAQKIADDCEYTAASNFAIGRRWDTYNLILGLLAAVLSALTAVLIDKGVAAGAPSNSSIPGAIAVLAALCASILTFLKPSEKASVYREYGNKYRALRNRSRVFISIDCIVVSDYDKLRSGLDTLLKEKEDLNLGNPVIPSWAFKEAQKTLEEKVSRKKVAGSRPADAPTGARD